MLNRNLTENYFIENLTKFCLTEQMSRPYLYVFIPLPDFIYHIIKTKTAKKESVAVYFTKNHLR